MSQAYLLISPRDDHGIVSLTPMARPFDAAILEMFARVREVRIETTSLDGARTHRTIIWIVTAGDEVFIRSVRGIAGRWYREARQRPEVTIHADNQAIPVVAVLANDAESVRKVSDAFEAKYGRRSPGSTASMLRPHTLETTIRLEPAEAGSGQARA
jgi:hypothetical protein